MDNPAIIFILAAVLLLSVVGVIYLLVGAKGKTQLDTTRYQTKWLVVENSFERTNPASWQLAVMNADKLLDEALRERGFKGTTMGERMKVANKTWKNANHVWGAHKIRNQLAHETDVQMSYDTAARSLSAFKQALKDLGAI
ncbi:MAG: hypothetical protein KA604_03570 [Candidatus Saccharimonas sp.]|nr:hypothetical protein [Candidatus Saccharimonas sp.]